MSLKKGSSKGMSLGFELLLWNKRGGGGFEGLGRGFVWEREGGPRRVGL